MHLLLVLTCVILAVSSAFAQRAPSTVVYSQYFTSYSADSAAPSVSLSPGASAKHKRIHTTKSPRGFRLLGPFAGTETITISLKNLPPHRKISVHVAYHIIGSWDGVLHQDAFTIQLDKATIFNQTYSNTTRFQSYPGVDPRRTYPARTGARNRNMLGFRYTEKGVFDGVMDATYENTVVTSHSDSTATLRFAAKLKDPKPSRVKESWGIEHIVIRVEGGELPSDIFPAKREQDELYDKEIVEYRGSDVRALALYKQDEDLVGVTPRGPWDRIQHSTMLRTKCMSCGDVCMMYTYIIYTDGWVNIWSNREPFGEALFSCSISQSERDAINELVSNCLQEGLAGDYHAPDASERADIEHCEIALRANGMDHRLKIEGGEPESVTKLMVTTLAILKAYGWYPSPFIQN